MSRTLPITQQAWKKRKFVTMTPSPKVSAAVKQYVTKRLKKIGELKYWDVSIGGTASSVAMLSYDLLQVTQGSGQANRIGDKINVKKIDWNLSLQPGDDYNNCRMILFTDKENVTATGTVITSLYGSPNPNVKLIVDKFVTPKYLSAVGNAAGQAMVPVHVSGSKEVDWIVNYPSGAGTNPSDRQLAFQFHSDSVAIPNPGAYGYVRVWFTDV